MESSTSPDSTTERLSAEDAWGDTFVADPASDVLRVVSLNVAGLPPDPTGLKYHDLHEFILSNQIDVLCLTELNQAWHCLPETSQFAQVVRPWFRSVFTKVAWFRDPALSHSFQRGGAAILVRDNPSGRVCGSGVDPTGLGRWTWIRLRGHHNSHVRIFSAYRPVANTRDLGSVWNQQQSFFLASDPPRMDDPRRAFLVDLQRDLQIAYDDGDHILVALDANEPTLWRPGNVLERLLQPFALTDMHLARHSRTDAPPTHNRGSRPIDAIFGTTALQSAPSGYLPFGSGPGDHRPLWVDLSSSTLFGTAGRTIPPSRGRKLQCRDPRVVAKYQRSLRATYVCHDVPRRTFALESSVLQNPDSSFLTAAQASEWEALDAIRCSGIKDAEASCRRLRTGKVPWHPALARALNLHRFWDRLYHRALGHHVSLSYLRRLASRATVEIPLSMPLDDILQHRQDAWTAYRTEKKRAPKARQSFLAQLVQARADAGLESAATGLQSLLRREKQRHDAALLRSILRPSSQQGLSAVEVPVGPGDWQDGEWTGAWQFHSDRQGIEEGCLTENDRRFHQATGTDLLTRPLVSLLGPTGCSSDASILLRTGRTEAFEDLVSPAALLYLAAHRRPSVLVAPHPFELDFRTAAYARSWQRMDEATSSGPSGLHFGHFMANSSDPVLAPVDAALAHIPSQTGYVPIRWRSGLNVMLEKKPGVVKVSKLRTILLYEAGYNHNNKLMGRSMMRYAEANDLLATEQYGSRKAHSAVHQCLNKVLTFDLVRQTRRPAALCSNDAKSCYDRIVHSAAGLAMQRCGVPVPLVQSSLKPIQQLRHYIRSVYGDSTRSFSAMSGDLPAHGIGQGNGAGPAIWAVVSTPIFNSMRQRGYGIYVRSPSGADFFFVGYAFVDDTDLVVNDPSPQATAATVISRLQTSINFWEASLRASGGALVPSKCHWYLLDYTWSQGKWTLLPPTATPGTISIRSPSGRQVGIERVCPTDARKTLGVWTAPDGSMTAELEYLEAKVQAWVERIRVRRLPHHLVWLSLRTGIYKTLEYPLAATTFTQLECQKLCTPLLKVGLSRSHIVRSMPRDVVHGPRSVGGLAVPNLYVEQGLAHLTAFILFSRSLTSITGCLLRASIEFLQLEVGTSVCPLELPFEPWADSAVPSWVRTLWQFCSRFSIHLPAPVSSPPLLREGDQVLMDAFWNAGIRQPSSLSRLNQCRMFLRAFSLADIVTCDGRAILPAAWDGSAPCSHRPRQETWPKAPPVAVLDWDLWRQSLVDTFGVSDRFHLLSSPLGQWEFPTIRSTLPLYCPTLNRLFIPSSDDTWQVWIGYSQRRGRSRFQATSHSISAGLLLLQPPVFPADVGSGSSPYRTLTAWSSLPLAVNVGLRPPRQLAAPSFDWFGPALVPFSQVWFDRPSSTSFSSLVTALTQGTLALVTDGSAQSGHSGTAAWCLAFETHQVSTLSAGFRVPGPAAAQCSFRSELAGLLAVAQLLRECCRVLPQLTGSVQFGTDSQAVLDRIFGHPRPANLRDHSWDLVSLTRHTLDKIPQVKWITRHIRGHQDEMDGPLDVWAKRNIAADERAGLVYDRVDPTDLPKFPPAPLPSCRLGMTDVVHDLAKSLREHTLSPPLLAHWARLGRFGTASSATVAWPSYEQALSQTAQSRRHWIIKSTAERSAVGIEMVRRRAWRSPVCPRCSSAIETSAHVFTCPHPEVRSKWTTALATLDTWLQTKLTHPSIRTTILQSLHRWSHDLPVLSPPTTVPFLQQAIDEQAQLGWDAALFGFWSTAWTEAQDSYFRFLGKRNSGRRWLSLLIQQLWDTAWDLWEHRNGIFHAQEAARALATRQEAIRELYASPPPLLTPALRLLFRRPLAQRLAEPQRIQELFIRRMTVHRSSLSVRRLRLQQQRFRQHFRSGSS